MTIVEVLMERVLVTCGCASTTPLHTQLLSHSDRKPVRERCRLIFVIETEWTHIIRALL